MRRIQVGDQWVGDECPSFIIAEVGSNHNNDLDLAKEHIDAAAEAGVDAVKFQTFRAESHYSKHTPNFGYLENKNTYELIQSLELNREWHRDLMVHAKKQGITFFSSPCDFDAIEQLNRYDVSLWKVASFDLPDLELIQEMAKSGKPVILSTGMADIGDIARAVRACRHVGNHQIILLQCTSLYPAPAHLSNLAAMASMRQVFGVLVGYSDHTIGEHIPIAAVAQGACMIEKHFTLNRAMPGPDHPFAIEPEELASMVEHIREVESAFGNGRKDGPRVEEQEMYMKGRRSLHARKRIPAGERITKDHIVIKRPGYGIPPHLKGIVLGRSARTDIEEDAWITWEMI